MLVMVVFFIAFRWIHLSTPLIRLFLLVLILLLMPTLNFLPVWFALSLLRFHVLVIRLRSLRLLRVSGIVMRLRMFLLLITFLKASHSFRNRLLVICKNAYLFATMIM